MSVKHFCDVTSLRITRDGATTSLYKADRGGMSMSDKAVHFSHRDSDRQIIHFFVIRRDDDLLHRSDRNIDGLGMHSAI
jgi:hypothetical protein